MKFTQAIRNRYAKENITIREKAVALLIINIFLVIGFLVLGIVRLAGGQVSTGIAEIGIGAIMVLFIVLITRGYYRIVSYAALLVFYAAAGVLFWKREIIGPNDIFALSTYYIPVLITTPLLSYTAVQVFSTVVLSIAAEVFIFFVKVAPALSSLQIEGGTAEFLVALIMSVFSGVLSYQLFGMQNRSLKQVQVKADESSATVQGMQKLCDSTLAALDVGELLSRTASENTDRADMVRTRLDSVRISLETLTEHINRGEQLNYQLTHSSDSVKENLRDQTRAIESAAEAGEDITSGIELLKNEVGSSGRQVDRIRDSTDMSVTEAEDTVGHINEIARSSENILEIIGVIDSIAEKTSMLAMNAAIEAAHAGEAGKGFAVVAEEIRKLSDITNENAHVIRETIEKDQALIAKAVVLGGNLRKTFMNVGEEVRGIMGTFSKIVEAVDRLFQSAGKISASTRNLTAANGEVLQSIGRMDSDIEQGMEYDRTVLLESQNVVMEISELLKVAAAINEEACKLEKIGEENRCNFTRLTDSIKKLGGDSISSDSEKR